MPKRQYTFREANLDDLSLLLKWTQQLMVHEAMAKDIELPLNENIDELLNDWLKNLITDNNSLIIIAVDESQTPNETSGLIIGYLQLQPNNFTPFNMHGIIQMVWVDELYRRDGLAGQLVTHMEDTFKNLKIPYCEIQYSDNNREAEGFWAKLGYQVVSHSSRKML